MTKENARKLQDGDSFKNFGALFRALTNSSENDRPVGGNSKIQFLADLDRFVEFKQVIDTKGFADSVALMKRKMFWFHYPDVDYRWITYSKIDGGWVDYDDLKKARKERKKLKQAQTKGR